jgi:hypothetical protein
MYGLSGADQTNHLTATYAYQVPNNLFRGRALRLLATGWAASGIYQLASGFPFDIPGNASSDQMGEYYAARISICVCELTSIVADADPSVSLKSWRSVCCTSRIRAPETAWLNPGASAVIE